MPLGSLSSSGKIHSKTHGGWEGRNLFAHTFSRNVLIATTICALSPALCRACDDDHDDDNILSNGAWPTFSTRQTITGAPLGSLMSNDPAIDNWMLATGAT